MGNVPFEGTLVGSRLAVSLFNSQYAHCSLLVAKCQPGLFRDMLENQRRIAIASDEALIAWKTLDEVLVKNCRRGGLPSPLMIR